MNIPNDVRRRDFDFARNEPEGYRSFGMTRRMITKNRQIEGFVIVLGHDPTAIHPSEDKCLLACRPIDAESPGAAVLKA
jgi:hypothetical protein